MPNFESDGLSISSLLQPNCAECGRPMLWIKRQASAGGESYCEKRTYLCLSCDSRIIESIDQRKENTWASLPSASPLALSTLFKYRMWEWIIRRDSSATKLVRTYVSDI